MPSYHLILCLPPLLLPSIFPITRVFSKESVFCIRWQSISVLASVSILSINIQDWFPSGLTGWILQSNGLSRIFSNTTLENNTMFKSINYSALFTVQLSHPCMTAGTTIAFTRQTFVGKVMSLLFNMLSSLVIAFLPRIKHVLTSWLQLLSSVILEPKKIKSVTVSIVSPSIFHELMGLDATILVFWTLSFEPTFSLSSFTFIKMLFNSSLSAIRVVLSAYLRLLVFLLAILVPACASSSPAFLMMYSACKLNKKSNNIYP